MKSKYWRNNDGYECDNCGHMTSEGAFVDGKQWCHPCADAKLGSRYTTTTKGKKVLKDIEKTRKYHVCLECQKLILPPREYESCNCSARRPSKEKFGLDTEKKKRDNDLQS